MPALARPATVYAVSEGDKFNTDHNLRVVTCYSCKIVYAIPESLFRSAKKYTGDRPDGWSICCPLGHTWHYIGESEEDRLRRQLKSEREDSARLAAQRDQLKQEASVQKARATRFKNDRDRVKERVGAGVCTECNRSFKQLAQHMRSKHPNCAPSEVS